MTQPPPDRTLRLHLSADALALSAGSQRATLPLGWARMGGFAWPSQPGGSDIEHAIDHIEDALQTVAGGAFGASRAATVSLNTEAFDLVQPSLGPIRSAESGVLTRDDVETAFRLWADAVQGGVGARQQRLGATPKGDAVLLLLREITHHWGMPVVTKRA